MESPPKPVLDSSREGNNPCHPVTRINKMKIPIHKFNMRLISKLPITTKLLIILLLISILPLFIVIYGFYSLGKAKLTEQTIHVLEVQSKNVEVSINHYLDYKFKHLSRVANIPQLTRLLENVKEQPRITHQTISSLRAKLRMSPDFFILFPYGCRGQYSAQYP